MASIRSIVNGTSQLAVINTGLNPYTQYECFVTANTSAGEGMASPILIVRTGQSGENVSVRNVSYINHLQSPSTTPLKFLYKMLTSVYFGSTAILNPCNLVS